jgi:hypothetical protein
VGVRRHNAQQGVAAAAAAGASLDRACAADAGHNDEPVLGQRARGSVLLRLVATACSRF